MGLHSRKNDHAVVGIKGTMEEASREDVDEPEEHENEIEITHANGRGYSAWAQPLHLAGSDRDIFQIAAPLRFPRN